MERSDGTKSQGSDRDRGSLDTTEMQPGWHIPEPETLPKPTYWPMVMALGITFLALGIVTTLLISGVGLILFALALAGWIGDLRHE